MRRASSLQQEPEFSVYGCFAALVRVRKLSPVVGVKAGIVGFVPTEKTSRRSPVFVRCLQILHREHQFSLWSGLLGKKSNPLIYLFPCSNLAFLLNVDGSFVFSPTLYRLNNPA